MQAECVFGVIINLTLSCLKKMDVRAHSTMESSVWSAMRHSRLKVLGLAGCSRRRQALILLCSWSSSGSHRTNSITSSGILGPCGEKGPGSELTVVAEPGEQLLLCSDFLVQFEKTAHWYWGAAGELDDSESEHSDGGW